MSLFSRLGDIINSNLTSMLDKAEDPEKLARQMVQEMEDTLVEVRSAAARALADRKEMDREIAEFTRLRDDWVTKAELAVTKGRDDLARGALQAKARAEQEITLRQRTLAAAEETIAKRNADLEKLQAKLDEAKAKHRAVMMRRDAAEGRVRLREALYDPDVEDRMSRFADMERKVDEMEAYADLLGPRRKTLEAEFAELEASEKIEDELEALRRRMSKRG
jgi:phage shock protein A